MVPVVATAGGNSRGRERPCCADREKGSEAVSPVAIVWSPPSGRDSISPGTTSREPGEAGRSAQAAEGLARATCKPEVHALRGNWTLMRYDELRQHASAPHRVRGAAPES